MIRKPSVFQQVSHLILILCVFLMVACARVPAVTPAATDSTDAELESAIRQARDSLDTFIEKLAAPDADRTFVALKVRFYPPGESPQDIWVDGVTYTNGVFRGDVGDDLPTLRLEAGEKITLDEEDILDWMIVEDGKLVGGYTIRLAAQRMSPEERQQFLETLDYSIED